MFSLIQKYVLYALSVLLALTLAYAGILYLRCGQLKNQVAALTQDLARTTDANAESQKTIAALTTERTHAARTCEARLQGYNATLAELQRIDNLRGETNEIQPSNFTPQPAPADKLLAALNGLFPDLRGADGRGQNGVCQTGRPAHAEDATILSGAVPQYCFCSIDDVKNLLKNIVLDRADGRELRTILEGLR